MSISKPSNNKLKFSSWIKNYILSNESNDFKKNGHTISNCIPNIFESYCKIFHYFELATNEPESLEVSLSNIKRINFDGLNDKIPINWATIALKYGLIFHNQINPESFSNRFQKIGWPKNLQFPSEGFLKRKQFISLLNVLEKYKVSSSICIYQTQPHSLSSNIDDIEIIVSDSKEVLNFFLKDFIGYLFAIDKSWIIYTDTDLSFTIVGGSKKLIESILISDIEAIECNSKTRVDNFSDRLNK